MAIFSNIMEQLQRRLFETVVSNRLVYNTCWEDPRVDRQLLQLNSNSRVLMLTSAGDNAFDYLLDHPQTIDCVDINPAQNALLEFKKALFKAGSFELLWDFFGEGKKPGPEFVYHQYLREHLSQALRPYWDQHIGYFNPTTGEPSFYFRGTTGKVALMIHKKIKRKGLYPQTLRMLDARSLKEQAYYFEEIEPQLWNNIHHWLMSGTSLMTMLGVPASQQRLIENKYQGGMMQYIRQVLSTVFTGRSLRDNYFWRVYLTGSYTPGCCPNYLCQNHFSTLSRQLKKIQTYHTSLLDYLKDHHKTYTHFVLLDHQDWLVNHKPRQLEDTWKKILAASETGTRVLFRSAAASTDFIPDFVTQRMHFQKTSSTRFNQQDRVGTYESTHLGIVE